MSDIRVKVEVKQGLFPELYQDLVALEGRDRAERLRLLCYVGSLKEQAGVRGGSLKSSTGSSESCTVNLKLYAGLHDEAISKIQPLELTMRASCIRSMATLAVTDDVEGGSVTGGENTEVAVSIKAVPETSTPRTRISKSASRFTMSGG